MSIEGFEREEERLVRRLLELGLVGEEDLARCRSLQRRHVSTGRVLHLGQILVRERVLRAKDIAEALAGIEDASRLTISSVSPPAMSPPRPEPTVQDWTEYEILAEIGRGGMGIVYRARQRSLGRLVALKVLPEGRAANPAEVARFEREAVAIARLRHPGIVAVHEAGVRDGVPFLAMDLIEGRSLRAALDAGSMPPGEAMRIAAEVARAIDHAHEASVVHRDLKPDNILLGSDGRAIVTDFGLARFLPGASGEIPTSLTQTGRLLGTPSYMSPEQVEGQTTGIDRRTDVFSLGVVLYEMLAGRLPFVGHNVVEVLARITAEEPRPPSTWRTGVPRDADRIVLTAIAKRREDRYRTAAEMADDLERALRGERVAAPRPPILPRLVRALFARRTLAVSLFAGTLAGAGAILALRPHPAPSAPTAPPAPPGQPEAGPGGREYVAEGIREKAVLDDGGDRFRFYEAVSEVLPPKPMVAFFPAASAPPERYQAWIEHLVRRGHRLAFVQYGSLQRSSVPINRVPYRLKSLLRKFLEDERVAWRDDRPWVAAGHAEGALIAAQVATVNPGGREWRVHPRGVCLFGPPDVLPEVERRREDLEGVLRGMPRDTWFVTVVSEGEVVPEAVDLLYALAPTRPERRLTIVLRSDDHGEPALVADASLAYAPATPEGAGAVGGARLDALDWCGAWSILDSLLLAVEAGDDGGPWLRDSPEGPSPGDWSDGVPVAPASIRAWARR